MMMGFPKRATIRGLRKVKRRLKLSSVPDPESNLAELAEFALTFDGYAFHGSFEKCAEIANARRHDTLDDLRTCLFFEQRAWHHSGEKPSEEAMEYIRELVRAIRAKVRVDEETTNL